MWFEIGNLPALWMLGPARQRWQGMEVAERVKLRIALHNALKNPKTITATHEATLPSAPNRPAMTMRYVGVGTCNFMLVAAGERTYLYDLWTGEAGAKLAAE